MNKSEYKELFLSDADEILANLNASLVELEKDPGNRNVLNDIFRHAHTFKSMAASMGYNSMAKLTHEMESLLDALRAGKRLADASTVSLLFDCFDALESLVSDVRKKKGKEVSDVTPLLESLERILRVPEKKIVPERGEDRKEERKPFNVSIAFSEDSAMRDARALIFLRELSGMGTVVDSEVLLERIKAKETGVRLDLVLMTNESPNTIKDRLAGCSDIAGVDITPLVTGERVERPITAEIQTIRVGVDHLDTLMNIVGELVINKIRLFEIGQTLEIKNLNEALTQMARLIDELQDQMMQVRLIPLEHIFNRLPRTVRDLAREGEKEIDFHMTGSAIGLGRTILDEIFDPLIHLLRNAVSHGIEEPKEREGLGKGRKGNILLSARRERNHVVVEVADDGRGMDVGEIRNAAVQQGIVSEEDASRLGPEDTMMLITHPGFSTQKNVTETAGRGVGLNAVRSKVESVGGSLYIKTHPGMGSTFSLKLPLTMAIIKALLVEIAGETFALPLVNVTETMRIDATKIKHVEHHDVIKYRDEILPLMNLPKKFSKGMVDKVGPTVPVVVVEAGSRKAGLMVGAFVGQQEIVIKTLSGMLKDVKGLSGATILGNGRVALILDVPSLLFETGGNYR